MKIDIRSDLFQRQAMHAQDCSRCLQAISRDQDKTAFIALVTCFAPDLKSFLKSTGGQNLNSLEADVQEGMIESWQIIADYSASGATASSLVSRIVRNLTMQDTFASVRPDSTALKVDVLLANVAARYRKCRF